MSAVSTRFKTHAMIEFLTAVNIMPTEIHCSLLTVYIVTCVAKTRMSISEFDRDNIVAAQ